MQKRSRLKFKYRCQVPNGNLISNKTHRCKTRWRFWFIFFSKRELWLSENPDHKVCRAGGRKIWSGRCPEHTKHRLLFIILVKDKTKERISIGIFDCLHMLLAFACWVRTQGTLTTFARTFCVAPHFQCVASLKDQVFCFICFLLSVPW